MFTEDQINIYKNQGATRCPYCQSKDIRGDEADHKNTYRIGE